eukprot:1144682-Pelagomonas_calceolata.AAC.3
MAVQAHCLVTCIFNDHPGKTAAHNCMPMATHVPLCAGNALHLGAWAWMTVLSCNTSCHSQCPERGGQLCSQHSSMVAVHLRHSQAGDDG